MKIIKQSKSLDVNGRTVQIPKLGLRHYSLFKSPRAADQVVIDLLRSIDENLTGAESEYVLVHLLAYNDRIQSKQTLSGFVVDIDSMYMCNKTKFTLDGVEYTFKAPRLGRVFGSSIDVLNECFRECSTGDIPDFSVMPARVLNWADDILKTVAIDTPMGTVYGSSNIIGELE